MKVLCLLGLIFFITKTTLAKNAEKLKSASLKGVIQTDESACHNFSVGNPQKREFYTPNYPNEYPKNTKCTFRITAPSGNMVVLDFRDQFQLEDSATCEYDKLEVRDGPYGYSPLIGTFCGSEFPKKQYSSKRYMWLQFSSDDSIEYTGFRAIYDFVPIPNLGPNGHDPDRECAFQRSGPAGFIYKDEIHHQWDKYQQDDTLDCMWTIEAGNKKKLYLNFNKFVLAKPNDCDQNFIQIFSESQAPDKEPPKYCGTTAEPHKSESNVSHIRYFSHKSAFNLTNFTIHYTALRELTKDEKCIEGLEFNCEDQTCVDIKLKCDNINDCKYNNDEDRNLCAKALGTSVILTSDHMIVILIIFFALVIAMCASISISCYNKIKERKVREREYKERRSKEASVEAARTVRSQSRDSPDRVLERLGPQPVTASGYGLRDADDESSDGCYVPEVDLSAFKRPNGGEIIQKKPRGPGLQQQQQSYPYISESFESLESDLVPPAPPPVPPHLKGAPGRDVSPPAPTYRIVGGKVIANPAKNEPPQDSRILRDAASRDTLDSKGSGTLDSRTAYNRWDSRPGSARPSAGAGYGRTMDSSIRTLDKEPPPASADPRANFLRGPLESGAPRSGYGSRGPAADIGMPKFGMARVTPDGPRGPLAGKGPVPLDEKGVPLATFRRPYEPAPYPGSYRPPTTRNYPIRTNLADSSIKAADASDKDSSRAHSAASSTFSAPDIIGKR